MRPWWWNWLALWEFVSVWGFVTAFAVIFESHASLLLWSGGGFAVGLIGALYMVFVGRSFEPATPDGGDENS